MTTRGRSVSTKTEGLWEVTYYTSMVFVYCRSWAGTTRSDDWYYWRTRAKWGTSSNGGKSCSTRRRPSFRWGTNRCTCGSARCPAPSGVGFTISFRVCTNASSAPRTCSWPKVFVKSTKEDCRCLLEFPKGCNCGSLVTRITKGCPCNKDVSVRCQLVLTAPLK